jgi:Cu/Ag efflux pump CusA
MVHGSPPLRLERLLTTVGPSCLLTSLITFLGLAPMIFESTIQARVLIPMVISLGFGILFATMIALVIIPCLYLVLVDIKRLLGFESAGVPDPLPATP